MQYLSIKKNPHFIGRKYELSKIKTICESGDSAILVVYGRRRVGKTELLEQAFIERNVLKFEGIEGLREQEQIQNSLRQLAQYTKNPLIAKMNLQSWLEFFELLADYTQKGVWTLYLEELQWLAGYESRLVSELKHAWDNKLRHNKQLIIILCGSSPSFMIDAVVHSKALYNRSQSEIHVKEFTILETTQFMHKRSNREIFDAYLTIGGIPEYLKWLNKASSVFLGLCQHSFLPDSFFVNEYEKIFTSSLATNKNYRKIIELLCKTRFLTRNDVLKQLGLKSSGKITDLLNDLEKCGFIEKYQPYQATEHSKLVRYNIADNYLQYYNKFIAPIKRNINNGDYIQNPQLAIKVDSYQKWLAFAFERWCRKNHMLIARILGFSNVQYRSGAYFNRATAVSDSGFQIDLLFDRADQVFTVCEIKYSLDPVPSKIIREFEKKISLCPALNTKTIHKILITSSEPGTSLKDKGYFDQIITMEMLIKVAEL